MWFSVQSSVVEVYLGVSSSAPGLQSTQSLPSSLLPPQSRSFARDGAIPGSKHLARVSQRHQMPVNAFLLCVVVQVLLSCLYFGSSAAFNAFISGKYRFSTRRCGDDCSDLQLGWHSGRHLPGDILRHPSDHQRSPWTG